MPLTMEQQAIEQISRAKHILILTQEKPAVDGIASVAGLNLLLQRLNKTFDIVIPEWKSSEFPSFLPATEIQSTIGALRTFDLQVNVEKTPLAELMYDVKENKLHISLVPKHGEWSPSDITFKSGEPRFDLIIAIGVPDMQALGAIAKTHADFLYRTPIINIDYHPSNEYWGQLNLVDLTSVSTTEVLYNWLVSWNEQFIDEKMATALLSGMVANTKSFRTNAVTPKTLKSASDLVTRGAKREQIVQGLWRTRPISTLKLWGRVLSRVEQDEELGILWSRLSQSDFIESGTSQDALEGVIDELLTYAPQVKTVILFSQTSGDRIMVRVHTLPPRSAVELTRLFSAEGTNERASFSVPATDLVQGTQQIIDRIKQQIRTLGV